MCKIFEFIINSSSVRIKVVCTDDEFVINSKILYKALCLNCLPKHYVKSVQVRSIFTQWNISLKIRWTSSDYRYFLLILKWSAGKGSSNYKNHKHTEADPKKQYAYQKACKAFSTLSTRTNILIWKYINDQIL